MKLKLTVSERLSAAQFLPAEGNTSEQMIGKSILDKTKLTKEEKAKIKPDLFYQGEIDPDTDFSREFDFSSEEFNLIYSEYRKKEDDKKLNKTNICMALKLIEVKDAIKEKK